MVNRLWFPIELKRKKKKKKKQKVSLSLKDSGTKKKEEWKERLQSMMLERIHSLRY
jgi:hypothetical protein